ncbi:hypothetical protein MIND_00071600 [Mycena indigotica]|uniref:Protein FAM72A n=1 Tax=Mycena indigotica TaxID=2126181 RepID=A0A8H6TD92_9AGAR|nr:uncharacterized protein MIND_00071600 [Mycena indigotica]KAF7315563.1 hypothetical protein MIND_00071600 [Mycena indigotica]
MFSGSYLNSWSSHLHPYVPPQPPPPPVMHKVYILDCAHCKTFLTNRGMKAVLLLRPSVALYSSDALPVNCSVYASPQALRSTCPAPPNNRSCECLTQSLACHTCGAFVGYAIVLPCVRCTSSISTPNRSTNGHRFVFHSAEIVGTERHYIHQETGVMVTSPPPLAAALHNTVYYRSPATSHHSQALAAVSRPEYLETPSLDGEDSDPPSPVAASFSGSSAAYPAQLLPVNQATPLSASCLSSLVRIEYRQLTSPRSTQSPLIWFAYGTL